MLIFLGTENMFISDTVTCYNDPFSSPFKLLCWNILLIIDIMLCFQAFVRLTCNRTQTARNTSKGLYTVHVCSHNIVHVCSEYSTPLLNFGLTPCEAILKSITSKQSLISTFTKRMFHIDDSPGFRSLLGQSQGRYRDQDNFDSTKSKYTAPRFNKFNFSAQ